MSRPWLKWHPKDWMGDKALRLCSLAARALWHELCLIAHDCEPYGHVLPGGEAPTVEEIAALVSAGAAEVALLLAELERRKVFSRGQVGEIVSRRMVRDERARIDAMADGKKGGNPHLRAPGAGKPKPTRRDNPAHKGRDKGGDKARARSDSDSETGLLPVQPFLQGTSPGGDAKPGKPASPTPTASRRIPETFHAQAIDWFTVEFERLCGFRPEINGKGGKAINAIETRVGSDLEEFKRVGAAYFSDEWHRGTGFSLPKFAGAFDSLRASLTAKKSTKPKQPGGKLVLAFVPDATPRNQNRPKLADLMKSIRPAVNEES